MYDLLKDLLLERH